VTLASAFMVGVALTVPSHNLCTTRTLNQNRISMFWLIWRGLCLHSIQHSSIQIDWSMVTKQVCLASNYVMGNRTQSTGCGEIHIYKTHLETFNVASEDNWEQATNPGWSPKPPSPTLIPFGLGWTQSRLFDIHGLFLKLLFWSQLFLGWDAFKPIRFTFFNVLHEIPFLEVFDLMPL
jgi:hypothetical protein